MKVGLDVSQAIYGTGVSDYTVELVRHLPPDTLTLVGFSLRRQADLKRLFPACHTYPISPTLLHYLWNKLHVYNFENFAPGDINIYHSSDWAQAPDSSKKVTTVHDLATFLYPSETSPNIVSAHTARMHWVVTECDQIICVSRSTQASLHRLFPSVSRRTIVIPEALPSRFDLQPTTDNLQPYILTIGARQPRKNISRLVSAFQKFKSQYRFPDKLVIIGESSHTGSVKHIPGVDFTGYVSDQDLVNYLANATAFVYPSLYEGFGLPILGAFHHKIPVATSDIPVFHETAGPAAVYFDPKDEESIAYGLSQAIKTKSRLAKLGTSQLAKFSWVTTAQKTLEVYKSII